jgi:DNA (cytosine-5)-methyltransferase 1
MKPKALDLFCGAGGATKGLQRAGFYVVGVDIKPQPRYCGDEFIQADAMEVSLDGYDFIWASPPCQKYTIAGRLERSRGKVYPDLIASVRERLATSGIEWVIENVPGSPLKVHLILCGSMFGLQLIRHRWFEFSFDGFHLVTPCAHHPEAITVCGNGTPSWMREKRIRDGLYPNVSVAMKREAMGIDWMNREELSQAIPPAYSEYIGKFAMQALEFASAK